MRKKKLMTQANQIRMEGVPALGTTELNGGTNNPIGYYNPDKELYKRLWHNYAFNQNVSKYVWKNLPNGYKSWQIERMLYYRHSIAGFYVGGRVYIMPWVTKSQLLNPNGFPTKISPITFNGRPLAGKNDYFNEGFELDVDYNGNETDKYSAVLLYDSVPYASTGFSPSRWYFDDLIIKEIADTFARININVVVSNKKIILQIKDAKQAEVVRKELEKGFGSDSPFMIVTTPLEAGSIQSSSDFNADELFNTIKNYDAIRCSMSGISSKAFGTDKKERLVSGELAGYEEEKDLILDMGLDLRKEFCELCNKKFGTNMSVEKRNDSYQDDINGRGNTQEEEEERL